MNLQNENAHNALMDYVSIFSTSDWHKLDHIVDNIIATAPDIFERPQRGDSRNENVALEVARFIVRKNGLSMIVNMPYSLEILNFLSRTKFVELIEQKSQLNNLNILRMQLNCMKINSFIATHTDGESDPAYEVTAIIRTSSVYSGGELYLYGKKPQILNQKDHSIFIMGPDVEHEVKMITNGYRNSLIIALGK